MTSYARREFMVPPCGLVQGREQYKHPLTEESQPFKRHPFLDTTRGPAKYAEIGSHLLAAAGISNLEDAEPIEDAHLRAVAILPGIAESGASDDQIRDFVDKVRQTMQVQLTAGLIRPSSSGGWMHPRSSGGNADAWHRAQAAVGLRTHSDDVGRELPEADPSPEGAEEPATAPSPSTSSSKTKVAAPVNPPGGGATPGGGGTPPPPPPGTPSGETPILPQEIGARLASLTGAHRNAAKAGQTWAADDAEKEHEGLWRADFDRTAKEGRKGDAGGPSVHTVISDTTDPERLVGLSKELSSWADKIGAHNPEAPSVGHLRTASEFADRLSRGDNPYEDPARDPAVLGGNERVNRDPLARREPGQPNPRGAAPKPPTQPGGVGGQTPPAPPGGGGPPGGGEGGNAPQGGGKKPSIAALVFGGAPQGFGKNPEIVHPDPGVASRLWAENQGIPHGSSRKDGLQTHSAVHRAVTELTDPKWADKLTGERRETLLGALRMALDPTHDAGVPKWLDSIPREMGGRKELPREHLEGFHKSYDQLASQLEAAGMDAHSPEGDIAKGLREAASTGREHLKGYNASGQPPERTGFERLEPGEKPSTPAVQPELPVDEGEKSVEPQAPPLPKEEEVPAEGPQEDEDAFEGRPPKKGASESLAPSSTIGPSQPSQPVRGVEHPGIDPYTRRTPGESLGEMTAPARTATEGYLGSHGRAMTWARGRGAELAMEHEPPKTVMSVPHTAHGALARSSGQPVHSVNPFAGEPPQAPKPTPPQEPQPGFGERAGARAGKFFDRGAARAVGFGRRAFEAVDRGLDRYGEAMSGVEEKVRGRFQKPEQPTFPNPEVHANIEGYNRRFGLGKEPPRPPSELGGPVYSAKKRRPLIRPPMGQSISGVAELRGMLQTRRKRSFMPTENKAAVWQGKWKRREFGWAA